VCRSLDDDSNNDGPGVPPSIAKLRDNTTPSGHCSSDSSNSDSAVLGSRNVFFTLGHLTVGILIATINSAQICAIGAESMRGRVQAFTGTP
jgi:hypothetical protein